MKTDPVPLYPPPIPCGRSLGLNTHPSGEMMTTTHLTEGVFKYFMKCSKKKEVFVVQIVVFYVVLYIVG
jgi:hypothetical protein